MRVARTSSTGLASATGLTPEKEKLDLRELLRIRDQYKNLLSEARTRHAHAAASSIKPPEAPGTAKTEQHGGSSSSTSASAPRTASRVLLPPPVSVDGSSPPNSGGQQASSRQPPVVQQVALDLQHGGEQGNQSRTESHSTVADLLYLAEEVASEVGQPSVSGHAGNNRGTNYSRSSGQNAATSSKASSSSFYPQEVTPDLNRSFGNNRRPMRLEGGTLDRSNKGAHDSLIDSPILAAADGQQTTTHQVHYFEAELEEHQKNYEDEHHAHVHDDAYDSECDEMLNDTLSASQAGDSSFFVNERGEVQIPVELKIKFNEVCLQIGIDSLTRVFLLRHFRSLRERCIRKAAAGGGKGKALEAGALTLGRVVSNRACPEAACIRDIEFAQSLNGLGGGEVVSTCSKIDVEADEGGELQADPQLPAQKLKAAVSMLVQWRRGWLRRVLLRAFWQLKLHCTATSCAVPAVEIVDDPAGGLALGGSSNQEHRLLASNRDFRATVSKDGAVSSFEYYN
ncbi:unnamed protein product [Amoebophrya sp. A25]|nr:unnamed protein product [Amoebophrya sp. A25]|eukprot:GSA25T00008022001.1